MALISECLLECVRIVLDTADIVREAMFRQLGFPFRDDLVLQSTTPYAWESAIGRMGEATMKNTPALTVLSLLNLGILIFIVSHHTASVQASGCEQVIRGRALEIVDGQGKVRASISVIPEGPAIRSGKPVPDGKVYPEAVLFRLIRSDGRPSVKIETTEQGSGLDLSGGIDPTYVVLSAAGGDPSLALTNKSGRLQIVKP